jgi:hypothetical protein
MDSIFLEKTYFLTESFLFRESEAKSFKLFFGTFFRMFFKLFFRFSLKDFDPSFLKDGGLFLLRIFFVFLFLFSEESLAEKNLVEKGLVEKTCPASFLWNFETYCLEWGWDYSSIKKKDHFIKTEKRGPHWIASQTPGSRWMYSHLYVRLWRSEDPQKISVPWPSSSVGVFVFMEMLYEPGHFDSQEFSWNDKLQRYEIPFIALHEMLGCWTLRLTTVGSKTLRGTHLIHKISEYVNLKPDQNLEVINMCEFCKAEDSSEGDSLPPGHHHNLL